MYKMETLIKTDTSFLRQIDFSKNALIILLACDLIKSKFEENLKVKILGGKKYTLDKKTIFLSNSIGNYNIMGQRFESQPFQCGFETILKIINEYFDTNFNGIIIDKYENGNHYTEPYSDYESYMNKNDVLILTSGNGFNRKMRIRERKTNIIVKDILMETNHVIQMGGEFQNDYKYEILADENVRNSITTLTFKKINTE
tara:strand:- start:6682 stop:7281 length:600 start_codon:yes stop_codon:yes gene_type:complete